MFASKEIVPTLLLGILINMLFLDYSRSAEKLPIELLSVKEYGPDVLARSANGLIALGKDEAVAVLKSWSEDPELNENFGFNTNERIGWLCRLVFERKTQEPLRAPHFGSLSLPDKSMPLSEWPHYPVVISDDVIFVLAEGYTLAGRPENPRDYVDYCQKQGHFREQPYRVPTRSDAEKGLNVLITSDRWKKIKWSHKEANVEYIYSAEREIRFLKSQVNKIKE